MNDSRISSSMRRAITFGPPSPSTPIPPWFWSSIYRSMIVSSGGEPVPAALVAAPPRDVGLEDPREDPVPLAPPDPLRGRATVGADRSLRMEGPALALGPPERPEQPARGGQKREPAQVAGGGDHGLAPEEDRAEPSPQPRCGERDGPRRDL